MTDADLARIERIKTLLRDAYAFAEDEQNCYGIVTDEELNDMYHFLDILAGANCKCEAFSFPHKRGSKCRAPVT